MTIFPELARFNERDLFAVDTLKRHGATQAEAIRVVTAQVDLRCAAAANQRKRIFLLDPQTRPAHTPRHQYHVTGSTSIAQQTGRSEAPNRNMAGAAMSHRAKVAADRECRWYVKI